MTDPKQKRPTCPCCGHRHTVGHAVAYYDPVDDIWRCARCHRPINGDGECRDGCCGWVPRRRPHPKRGRVRA